MKNFKKFLANSWAPFALFLILALDQLSKAFVDHYFARIDQGLLWYPYGGIGVFKDFFGVQFSLVHAINKGAAWSVFENYQLPLLFVRILLIVALIVFAYYYNKDKRLNFPLSLIIIGAIGNVIDFFIYGHVVDMFHFVFWGYSYPIFNVADMAVCIGVGWLVLDSLFTPSAKPKKSCRK